MTDSTTRSPRTRAGKQLLRDLVDHIADLAPQEVVPGEQAVTAAILAIEAEAAAPDAHTHDLRIGAREYEGGNVRAWQGYCVICDEAGRIVLPEAAAPDAGRRHDIASLFLPDQSAAPDPRNLTADERTVCGNCPHVKYDHFMPGSERCEIEGCPCPGFLTAPDPGGHADVDFLSSTMDALNAPAPDPDAEADIVAYARWRRDPNRVNADGAAPAGPAGDSSLLAWGEHLLTDDDPDTVVQWQRPPPDTVAEGWRHGAAGPAVDPGNQDAGGIPRGPWDVES